MAPSVTDSTMSTWGPAAMTSFLLPGSTPSASSALLTMAPTVAVTGEPSDITVAPYPPITTHWSRPSSCTWTYVVDNSRPPPFDGPVAWLDLEPVRGATTLSCYPDGMFQNKRAAGTFSPATCPNGWTTVSITVNTDQPPEEATTTALCCSSEYTLDGKYCKRQISTALAVPITYNRTASTYEVFQSSTTTLYSATLAVHTIRALFRADDQSILGITDDSDIDDDPEPWHLSIGEKIGIGVGVTIFGLLTLAALISLFLRGRRKKRDCLKGRSHEMSSMRSSGSRPLAEEQWPAQGVSNGHPADLHEHGASEQGRNSPHEPQGVHDGHSISIGDGDSGSLATHDEIRALMAQKAAIQRRIEQLERNEDGHERTTTNPEKPPS